MPIVEEASDRKLPVTAKLVEVAFVVVAFDVDALMKFAFTKYDVEDAKMPDCAQIGEVVAAEMAL